MQSAGSPAATLLAAPLAGRWWVAHTRPRAEKALSSDLTRFDIPNYLPLCRRMTRSPTTNRISRSTVPVFTGYLFFAATEEQRCQAVRTNRVANVLTVTNQERLVAELRQIDRVLASDTAFARKPRIQVGCWTRIISGPLAGLEGVVSSRTPPLRLFLNVDILGQSITVETSIEAVQPIDPPTYAREGPARKRRRA